MFSIFQTIIVIILFIFNVISISLKDEQISRLKADVFLRDRIINNLRKKIDMVNKLKDEEIEDLRKIHNNHLKNKAKEIIITESKLSEKEFDEEISKIINNQKNKKRGRPRKNKKEVL